MAEARSIEAIDLIRCALDGVSEVIDQLPKNFCANYTREWKTWSSFVRGAERQPELTCADFSFETDGPLLTYQNSLVGFTNPPEYGSIELAFSAPESICSADSLLSVAHSLCSRADFHYGYVNVIDDSFDPMMETKIKKSMFGGSISIEVNEDGRDSAWLYHMLGVKSGYFRSVYGINILNASHLANPAFGSLIEQGIGTVEDFCGDLKAWRVSDDDLEEAIRSLAASGSLIWHESGHEKFMASESAGEFYKKMWPDA